MTVTTERLFIADWASFSIADARDVILALNYAAVMTRLTICAPIIRFIAIADSSYLFSVNYVCWFLLSFLDLLRPLSGHFDAVINYIFVRHEETLITNPKA